MALSDKIPATIVSVHRTYAFAQDADGTRYFLAYNSVEYMSAFPFDFESLQVGAQVRLLPIAHPKGPRGIEVQILSLENPLDGM